MRVTNSMITDQLQRNINQGLSRLQKLQLQLSSSKAILEASARMITVVDSLLDTVINRMAV